jgi:hypothetical protein
MKIYSALFIALVASHNGLFADVSAAADTASPPIVEVVIHICVP